MILCVGESLMDLLPGPDGRAHARPGGAVFNTAVALGRLGAPVGYLWPLSTDEHGERLAAALRQAGVDVSVCPRPDRPTTLARVTLIDGEAGYVFEDAESAGRHFRPADLPPLPSGLDALFIGGISLVPDPCGSTVELQAAKAARAGAPIMIDPNIRPAFITQPGPYRARLDRLLAQSAIVKLSADDLAWLWPGLQPQDAARRLIAGGAALVLTTAGAKGATAHTRAHSVTVPAARTRVADTIGAGDSFNAALLDGLLRAGALAHLDALGPETLTAALTRATRAAAITVSRPGADPPWAHELG